MIRLELIIKALRAYKMYHKVDMKDNTFTVKHNGKSATFNIHNNYIKGALVGDGVPAIINKKFGVEL